MDKRTFQSAVFELSVYFERKPPTDETINQWVEEVKDIPNRHAQELIGAVKRLENWPRNLPNFLRGKSSELAEKNGDNQQYKIHDRRFHPERYAEVDCKKCSGKGLYDLQMNWPVGKKNGEVIFRQVVRQALCECTESAEYGF